MTREEFDQYLDSLPGWPERAHLISYALDLLPVGTVVGHHRRIADIGMNWESVYVEYKKRRDGSVRRAESRTLGFAWNLGLQVTFDREKKDDDYNAILDAAWRAIKRVQEQEQLLALPAPD